jgi:hypothetical protein
MGSGAAPESDDVARAVSMARRVGVAAAAVAAIGAAR